MTLSLQMPENSVLKPQITVFGVGGAGCNATNNMIKANLEGATFVVANTDAQSLENSASDKRVQLGRETTKGLGAGASPDVGCKAAEETIDEIKEHLQDTNMVFIAAGMGGGTGTGAAPVIARAAKDLGILTVGVVTKPFHFEGPRRMRLAEEGLEELQQHVDTLIIIPNQNLFRVANEKTTFAEAFAMADAVLHAGVRGITDLMVMPGLINLDFADVRAVMTEMGKAMMGTGEADGDRRASEAAEAAISNPLLDSVSMKGARGVLINITGGSDMTLFEVDEAANRIREEVDASANIIFGSTFSDELEGRIRVSVVATGIDSNGQVQQAAAQNQVQEGVSRSAASSFLAGGNANQIYQQETETIADDYTTNDESTYSAPEINEDTPSFDVNPNLATEEDLSAAPIDNFINEHDEEGSQTVAVDAYEKLKEDVENTLGSASGRTESNYYDAVNNLNEEFERAQQTELADGSINEVAGSGEEPQLFNDLGQPNFDEQELAQQTGHVEQSAPTFVPTPAREPQNYVQDTTFSSPLGDQANLHHYQEDEDQDDEAPKIEKGGLFSRVARGVAKSLTGVDTRDPNWQEDDSDQDVMANEEVPAATQSGHKQEDIMDVPAFLRRNK